MVGVHACASARAAGPSSRAGDLEEALLEAVADGLEAHHADSRADERGVERRGGVGRAGQDDAQAVLGGMDLADELARRQRGQGELGVVDAQRSARAPAPAPAASSAIGPCVTTLPRSTIAAASQILSTSSSRWEEMNTVRPSCSTICADHFAELLDAARIEAVRRLVEDQQPRICEQATRDPETLAHAERVALDLVVGALGEADAGERRADPLAHLRAAHRGDDAQVLATRQVGVEAGLLDDRPDALRAPWRARRAPDDRASTSCPRSPA